MVRRYLSTGGLSLALLLAAVTSLFAQVARPTLPAAAPAATSSQDEAQVKQGVVAFVEAFNSHKADAVVALFTSDARMVLRDGTEVNGADELKASFEEGFAAAPKSKISVVVDSIRFITPDVAVEEGTTSNFPDGETLTAKSRYTVVHLKKEGKWKMLSVRVVEEESLSAYGELQPLEWLVGDWVDEGKAERVETKIHWDENKSFLIEDFEVLREGEVVLKGTQRIGWDPQAKQIRSWTFDSAGGFGEAVWSRSDEDRWVVKAKAVLADGGSASATRTLIRKRADQAIWSSTERFVGDEALPDLAVTMVRKAPKPGAQAKTK